MRSAAFTFLVALIVPVRMFPGGGEPVPVVYPPDVLVEAWQVERAELTPWEPTSVDDQVWQAMRGLGRSVGEYECALVIFRGESSMRPDAVGDGGNSFGLGQRHAPAHGRPPDPWPVADQVEWFDDYAHRRYGGWCEASDRWLARAAARNGAGHW